MCRICVWSLWTHIDLHWPKNFLLFESRHYGHLHLHCFPFSWSLWSVGPILTLFKKTDCFVWISIHVFHFEMFCFFLKSKSVNFEIEKFSNDKSWFLIEFVVLEQCFNYDVFAPTAVSSLLLDCFLSELWSLEQKWRRERERGRLGRFSITHSPQKHLLAFADQ